MDQKERVERLEFILGTLIGSMWASGKLDEQTRDELNHLIETDHWPMRKPVQRANSEGNFTVMRTG